MEQDLEFNFDLHQGLNLLNNFKEADLDSNTLEKITEKLKKDIIALDNIDEVFAFREILLPRLFAADAQIQSNLAELGSIAKTWIASLFVRKCNPEQQAQIINNVGSSILADQESLQEATAENDTYGVDYAQFLLNEDEKLNDHLQALQKERSSKNNQTVDLGRES